MSRIVVTTVTHFYKVFTENYSGLYALALICNSLSFISYLEASF